MKPQETNANHGQYYTNQHITREISSGSPDTQWWVQLSTAIVFGLIFATLLTLIVTPSALMLRENLKCWYIDKIKS